jgi:RIO-like serine/threonine protein kinase
MDPHLTYSEALSGIVTTITKGRFLKADVHVVRTAGRKAVVKDFGAKGFWERNLMGRLVTSRELRAYRALSDIEGLPSQFLRLSPFALAIEYLEGRDLGSFPAGGIGPGLVLQFERIVEDLHERGWVHLDLQKRSNILVVHGKVYVVDLASAFHPGGVPLIGGLLTRLLMFFDRLSLIKVKLLYAPELLTEHDRKWIRLRNLVMPRKWR